MGRLEGKSVIVTGSTKGFGEAMVRRFAQEGANVVVTGRNTAAGQAVASEIRDADGSAVFIPSEMSDEASVQELVSGAVAQFGALHGLVNNAMSTDLLGSERPVADMDSAEFDKIVKVGLYGVFYASKHTVPHLIKAGGGSIVNISSVAAVAGVASMPAYSMCKAAIGALARQMTSDYGRERVRVNTIVSGLILGDGLATLVQQHPIAGPAMAEAQVTRYGRHDDITGMASYLLSDESEFVTGAEIRVDGGWTSAARIPNLVELVFADAAAQQSG